MLEQFLHGSYVGARLEQTRRLLDKDRIDRIDTIETERQA
jgi:hypothetical protein